MKSVPRLGLAAVSLCALAAVSGCSVREAGDKVTPSPSSPVESPHPQPHLNGIDDLPASEVVDAASDELRGASSVHISGTLNKSQMDLRMDSSGNCRGRVTQDGTNVDVVKQGDRLWLKPDHAFWVQAAGDQATRMEALVGDRYIATDSSNPEFVSFAAFCDIPGVADSLTDGSPDDTLSKGGTRRCGVCPPWR
ncbi:hypothetical protein ACH3VS_39460 [Streptomyces sp. WSLK1-3]|uniref:hypothetical protein n=1 Tax=Streptomyces sp. WSLK1-3 TaxID=3375475 RepID=UPI0037B6A5E7